MTSSAMPPLPPHEICSEHANLTFNLQKKEFAPYVLLDNCNILGDTSIVTSCLGDLAEDVIGEALYWCPVEFPLNHLGSNDVASALIEERKHFLAGIKHLYFKHFGHNAISHQGEIGIYLCHPLGFYAYEQLFDSLQRLYSIRHLLPDARHRFVVSDYEHITDFLKHISILWGNDVREEDVILASARQVHRFEQLIVPFSPAMPTSFTPDTYNWAFNAYVNCFVNAPDEPVSERLYLSGNHNSHGSSKAVINEEDVTTFLNDNGFKVIHGNEPLDETVRNFYNAKIVVGCHGPQFVNTIFCRPETKIIEYVPSNRINSSILNMHKHAQDYVCCSVESDENLNMHIPVDDLVSRLAPFVRAN